MKRTDVREPDLIATFACPDERGPFPPVLALSGSDGGIPEYYLERLVGAGFAVLALAYHRGRLGGGDPDLPEHLIEIPLERIARGARWLLAHSSVTTPTGRVGVVGGSKGGELALVMAATFPDLIGPVVAYTPSCAVWQGIDWTTWERRSSWSHHGEPLPFVPNPPGVGPSMSERGMALLPLYAAGLEDVPAVERAAIPVERATGPILLVSGGDDRMWPAEKMCRMIVQRMAAHGRTGDVSHLNYPDAGHILHDWRAPLGPSDSPPLYDLGGTPEAAAAAEADARPFVVRTLRSLIS